jgi:hypothetical protein
MKEARQVVWKRAGRPSIAAIGVFLLVVGMAMGPPHAASEVVQRNLWGADGNVVAVARSGNTLYIAGAFRSVGPNTGGGVPLSVRTGEATSRYPKVTGAVNAVVSDGRGGWYIGGGFTAVNGQPRTGLAHVLAEGSVSEWAPQMEASRGVSSLVLKGSTLYVGGTFQTLNGRRRNHVAALDAVSGAVLRWNPDADQGVNALALSGNTIYLAGEFTHLGGKPRSCIAAVDAETGAATDWAPEANRQVLALCVQGNTVYAGGYFSYIGGAQRHLIAAVDAQTGRATDWDPHASGPSSDYGAIPHVNDLAVRSNTVYAAGCFDSIGGSERGGVAALDVSTGAAAEWKPLLGPRYTGYAPPTCEAVVVHGGVVYVGGWFNTVDGRSRPGVAALEVATGAVTDWNPRANGPVKALATDGDEIYVGGEFGMLGLWEHRAGLAALNATTGMVKPWNPNPDGTIVTSLAVRGGAVYVSGDFASIGGKLRSYIAALDTTNGEASAWNPGANDIARAMVLSGNTLYVGGQFTQIGGQRRKYIAALDATNGVVTAWNPEADYDVFALASSGSTIYAGGLFERMGGQPRNSIAAIDAVAGTATEWNPNAEGHGWVSALVVQGSTIYVGGSFDRIGGQARNGLGAIDGVTGGATAWDPAPVAGGHFYPEVDALACIGGRVYVGGDFSSVGLAHRNNFAVVDTVDGFSEGWDPGADGRVWALASEGGSVYVGGGFSRLGELPCAALAAVSVPAWAPPDVSGHRHLPPVAINPNPVHSWAEISFALESPAAVDLDFFDIQGRRVATLLHEELLPAGEHGARLHTEGWPAGFYFCRLTAGGAAEVRKLLVVN